MQQALNIAWLGGLCEGEASQWRDQFKVVA